MSFVRIPSSPLLAGGFGVDLFVRKAGQGAPLLVLHGGWGHDFYPFDAQIAALGDAYRFVIPDRTGYGKSPRVATFAPRFHEAAAIEAEALLDALAIDRCVIWGHSDGAVIATLMAIRSPARYRAIILEALHVERAKPRSRAFFTQMAEDPDSFGPRVTAKLAAEHGDDWRAILRADGRVWLDIAATPGTDTFDHRLHELRVPTLLVHGSDDPRTEPGELDRIRREVPQAQIAMIAGAGHSPHSERAHAAEVTAIVARFLRAAC
ncbi:MAG: alpha/beta fold hydrolase [Deltaproteobacteria bacterium]|nr:alpha/beta fold hydrolase [Deltaproteobacteria bacterium]MDQ3295223.1 alpha/beta hydrolase [Myxococcota bacterium]